MRITLHPSNKYRPQRSGDWTHATSVTLLLIIGISERVKIWSTRIIPCFIDYICGHISSSPDVIFGKKQKINLWYTITICQTVLCPSRGQISFWHENQNTPQLTVNKIQSLTKAYIFLFLMKYPNMLRRWHGYLRIINFKSHIGVTWNL